jgi:phasin family protein
MPSYSNRPTFQPGFEAQVNFMTELTRKTSDSVRKLSELNLQFTQHMLQDSFEASRRLLACSDPFQLAATAVNAAQPAVEHLRSYQQQLVSMFSGAQIDLSRSAEPLMSESSRYAQAMASAMSRGNGRASDTATHASFTPG